MYWLWMNKCLLKMSICLSQDLMYIFYVKNWVYQVAELGITLKCEMYPGNTVLNRSCVQVGFFCKKNTWYFETYLDWYSLENPDINNLFHSSHQCITSHVSPDGMQDIWDDHKSNSSVDWNWQLCIVSSIVREH